MVCKWINLYIRINHYIFKLKETKNLCDVEKKTIYVPKDIAELFKIKHEEMMKESYIAKKRIFIK